MTHLRTRKKSPSSTSSPAAALSFFFLLLLCVSPCSSSNLFSSFSRDLAALESPPPSPSSAAEGKRYLISTLSVGPSHAFVLARVARELYERGGSVALLCPASMRPFFDTPPPGIKTLAIEVGKGGGDGDDDEGGRVPTEADFSDESVRWRVIHYETSGELTKRLGLLMKRPINDRLPWVIFDEFADALSVECDEILSNARLVAASRLFNPDVLVGDQMEPCFSVFGEKAFRTNLTLGDGKGETRKATKPLPPFPRPSPPPRVSVHNGPVLVPAIFDSPGFQLIGRSWGVPSEVGALPVFGAGLPPPFALRDRVSNLAQLLAMIAHNYFRTRPVLEALHERHGVSTSLASLRRDALLVLQGDWALDWPRPMPPSVLVPGPVMPGPPARPLPRELEQWLVDAKRAGEKVVLAALGATFILTPEKSKAIVRALDEACSNAGGKSARILIKLSEKDLPASEEASLREEMLRDRGRDSRKLLVSRWLPQNDLLASGGVDVAVTHGGISSLSEAAFHGVPVVALPQGAEQPDNAAKVEYRGLGVGLKRGATVEELAAAVREVLEDKDGKFSAAARNIAVRMRAGRPPAASAVAAAIERVAVASAALSDDEGGVGWEMPGLRVPWFQRNCLDSGLVLFGLPLAVLILVSNNVEVNTRWDKVFWLDARGIGEDDGDEEDEEDDEEQNIDDDPTASAFRSLLSALGGSSVPGGSSDRDRVLLRARALFGDESGARGGLVVRLGGDEHRRRGTSSALLEVLGAARGLSVVAVGGRDDGEVEEERDVFFARVVVRSLSGEEARSFLQRLLCKGDENSTKSPPSSSLKSSSPFALPPPLRDVRVIRAIAGLQTTTSRSLLFEEELERHLSRVCERASSPSSSSSSSSFLASLLVRSVSDPALLLSLSRLSRSLLRGSTGSFSLFAAAATLNCDCGKALETLRSLEALGLAHSAEAVTSSSSSSSYWSLGSLAATAGAQVDKWTFSGDAASTDSLASLARVAHAASATMATSLEFARGGGGKKDCCSGGSALASHWVSKERALFSSAIPLARLLVRREARTEESSEEKQGLVSSAALSSLSELLWSGGDKLLPGLLGLKRHSMLARAVERAAAAQDGEKSSSCSSANEAAAARAAFSLGAALCARGRWNDARAPLLRSLGRSDALARGQKNRIASMMARVEYKSRGDLGSAADLYAKASCSSSSPWPSSCSSSAVVDVAALTSSSSTSSDLVALEQEAEALEGAAGLLRHAGREADALACYRSSLAARAAIACSSSSSTSSSSSPTPTMPLSLEAASTANNAAVLLVSAGARLLSSGDAESAKRKFNEADLLYSEALRARELLLGPDDPSVASVVFNRAALSARRGERELAREWLQRAASVRELSNGRNSVELAEVHAALALWPVVAAVASAAPVAAVGGEKASGESDRKSERSQNSSSSSLCLSKREARAHARAALSIFEKRYGVEEQARARQQRLNAIAQLKRFLFLGEV